MVKDKLDRTLKLARFRKFTEDNAAIRLRSASRRLLESRDALDEAAKRVEAISRWKAVVDGGAILQVAVYDHALELEGHAMTAESRRIDEESHATKLWEEAAAGYRTAVDRFEIVDRRRRFWLNALSSHQERSEADAISDLWLAKKVRLDV